MSKVKYCWIPHAIPGFRGFAEHCFTVTGLKATCREIQAAWNFVFFPDKYCLIKEVNDDNILKLQWELVFE